MSEMQGQETLCMGCMHGRQNNGEACPRCGWNDSCGNLQHQLATETILDGKYIVGRALGQGGNAITYIGFDLALLRRVAIKEYFPASYCSRPDAKQSPVVTPAPGDKETYYYDNRSSFLNEARALVKFESLPGIAKVREYFEENNTAYIVLDYIEGINLLEYLGRRGGKIPADEVFSMIQPVMGSLSQVHKAGVIHRDISPENIIIESPGRPRLIDFGSAMSYINGAEGADVMLKPGYAPPEQYNRQGVQGPWTDIYALCATMYKLITGVTPPDALARMQGTPLALPSDMGIEIDPIKEQMLMQGLAVDYKRRFSDVAALYRALYMAEKAARTETNPGQPGFVPKPVVYVQESRPEVRSQKDAFPEPAAETDKREAEETRETKKARKEKMPAKVKKVSPFTWIVFALGTVVALAGIAAIVFFAMYLL